MLKMADLLPYDFTSFAVRLNIVLILMSVHRFQLFIPLCSNSVFAQLMFVERWVITAKFLKCFLKLNRYESLCRWLNHNY